ncbi:Alpha-mannosidase 2x, partial [Dissostichus eleginoides]
ATTDTVPLVHPNLDLSPAGVSYPACSPLRGVGASGWCLEPFQLTATGCHIYRSEACIAVISQHYAITQR